MSGDGNIGGFATLPYPVQVMMMQRMHEEQRQRQAMTQARGQAGQILMDQFGAQPQPNLLPAPPMAPPQQQQAPPAPPPGTLSPGGGNPQAQQGMVPQPPPQGASSAGAGQSAAPPPQAAPQPIPPFQPMPSAPPPMAGGGEVPPPPAGGPASGAAAGPRPINIASIVMGLKQSGVAPDQVMNVLDTLAPTMNAQNQQEIAALKAETSAQSAATRAYQATMAAWKAEQEIGIKRDAEERRLGSESRKQAESEMKIKLMEARAQALVGGGANLKKTEILYPNGADGKADITQGPVGTRLITKTGKIIFMDIEGRQVPTIAGATAAEARSSRVDVRDTVRANLVEGSAFNALNRLDEIEKAHPRGTVSLLFGKSPGDSLLMGGAHAAVRGAQDPKQQDVDAKWASFIDEAIPVFTGGLRGSDAFRKFLIEQAPVLGTKPEVITEKMRLFRENIAGTRAAFKQKFASDPKMWGEGVTKEQVAARGGAGAPPKPPAAAPAGAPKEGQKDKSKSGKPMTFTGGQWVYD